MAVGIYFSSNYSRVISNYIQGFNDGIQGAGSTGLACSNNVIKSPGNRGIIISANSNAGYGHHVVSNNIIYSPGGDGIEIQYGNRITINGNAVYGAGRYGYWGRNTGTFNLANCSNNIASGCTSDGFNFVAGSYNFYRSNFNANLSSGNSGWGYNFNVTQCNITSNMADGNTLGTYQITNGAGNSVNNI